jgi:hypothetical protein
MAGLEISYILVSIVMIYLFVVLPVILKIIAMGIFLFYTFFNASMVQYIRETINTNSSIIKQLMNYIDTSKKNYFLYFIYSFLEQILSGDTIFWLILYQVSNTFFVSLKWPDSVYYGLLLLIPIFSNTWIYFTYRLSLKDKASISIRRIIVYVLLIAFSIRYNYFNYMYYIKIDNDSIKSEMIFLLNTASVLFVAIERLLKAWTEHYLDFKKSHR